jgi:hypothetical protein
MTAESDKPSCSFKTSGLFGKTAGGAVGSAY